MIQNYVSEWSNLICVYLKRPDDEVPELVGDQAVFCCAKWIKIFPEASTKLTLFIFRLCGQLTRRNPSCSDKHITFSSDIWIVEFLDRAQSTLVQIRSHHHQVWAAITYSELFVAVYPLHLWILLVPMSWCSKNLELQTGNLGSFAAPYVTKVVLLSTTCITRLTYI